jgi:hypothetical protein
MGLDGVELLMELEKEFDISIPDAVATQIDSVDSTVKMVVQFLREKGLPGGICQTAHAFYELRKQAGDRLGVPRDRVRLEVPIGELVPRGRGREWQKIADASGLRGERGLFQSKRTPPPEMSVRDVVQSRCKKKWQRIDGSIDEEEVFRQVQLIVSEQMGVPIESIRRETRYVEDLGF